MTPFDAPRTLLVLGAALGCAFAPTPTLAQTFPTDDPVIQGMWEQGMEGGSQVEVLAQALMDSIGPRLMGSPAYDRAGDWLLKLYADWGVAAEKQEYGTWNGWVRGYTHIDLLEPRVRTLEGMMLAWSPGTDGPVEGEVVAMPIFETAADFDQWLPSVSGKFVAISQAEITCRADESWEEYATEASFERLNEARTAAAQSYRAGFQVFMQNGGPARLEEAGARGVLTGNWSRGWGVDKIFSSSTRTAPSVHLSCEDYSLVHRLASNGQGPLIRLDAEAEALGDVPAFNVIGTMPGTELPDEYVLLTAHLDSWDGASGATDNGTGTIMMLEAMRILKETYPNPRRTIVVGHWGGEEQGLIGSTAYAADNPEVVDGLQAAFNQDNGTWRIDFIRMQGFIGAGRHFARWFESIPAEITSHIELDIPGVPERGGSDHMSFICKPAPGFRLQSNYPDYRQYTWHTNRDTYDKIVFDDLKNNATLAAMLAYAASEDPDRVQVDLRALPTDPRTGQAGTWPQCRPPRRSSGR
ncbi:MAG: M20/M25/M40 family metallo-hydrolase [Longimicrobiales bacterium]